MTLYYEVPAPTIGSLVRWFQGVMMQMQGGGMQPGQPAPPPPDEGGVGGGVF